MNRSLMLFGLVVLFALTARVRSAEPERSRPMLLGPSVTLLKVEEKSITVKLAPTQREASKELTLAIDPEKTKVSIGEVTAEEKTEDGGVRYSMQFRPGVLADVKAGQRALVTANETTATEIRIMPLPSRKGGNKEGEKPAEKK